MRHAKGGGRVAFESGDRVQRFGRSSAAHWRRIEVPNQEAYCGEQPLPSILRPLRVGTQDPRASIEALEAFVKIVGQRMEAST
jgi:hypothetical protein